MSTEIQKFGNTVHVVHQPGNGTRYEAVGVKMPKDFPGQEGAWLVTFPNLGMAHFFREGNFLAVSYVAEKLAFCRNGIKNGEVDLHEMTKVITTITGGENNATTNDEGEFPTLRIAR